MPETLTPQQRYELLKIRARLLLASGNYKSVNQGFLKMLAGGVCFVGSTAPGVYPSEMGACLNTWETHIDLICETA